MSAIKSSPGIRLHCYLINTSVRRRTRRSRWIEFIRGIYSRNLMPACRACNTVNRDVVRLDQFASAIINRPRPSRSRPAFSPFRRRYSSSGRRRVVVDGKYVAGINGVSRCTRDCFKVTRNYSRARSVSKAEWLSRCGFSFAKEHSASVMLHRVTLYIMFLRLSPSGIPRGLRGQIRAR